MNKFIDKVLDFIKSPYEAYKLGFSNGRDEERKILLGIIKEIELKYKNKKVLWMNKEIVVSGYKRTYYYCDVCNSSITKKQNDRYKGHCFNCHSEKQITLKSF